MESERAERRRCIINPENGEVLGSWTWALGSAAWGRRECICMSQHQQQQQAGSLNVGTVSGTVSIWRSTVQHGAGRCGAVHV